MSISSLRDTIKTALQTITGLRAYDTAPDSIAEVPAAYVIPKTGEYDHTAGGDNYRLMFEVVLLVRRIPSPSEAQDSLDDYIAPSGTKSIKAALEAADILDYADALRVEGFRDYGGLEYAGQLYLGVKFDVEVILRPQESLTFYNDTEKTTNSVVVGGVKLKEMVINRAIASATLTWEEKYLPNSALAGGSYTIYKNNTSLESTGNLSPNTYTQHSLALTNLVAGDLIKIYAGDYSNLSGLPNDYIYIRNMRLTLTGNPNVIYATANDP